MVQKIGKNELNQLVKNNSKPLVIDCYADWCGPCKMSSPQFETLSKKYPNAQFVKVNVDEEQAISYAFKIRAVPSFFILRGNKIVRKVEGANIPKLESLLVKELKENY